MCYKMMKSVDLYKKKASGDIYLIHQRLFYEHALNHDLHYSKTSSISLPILLSCLRHGLYSSGISNLDCELYPREISA